MLASDSMGINDVCFLGLLQKKPSMKFFDFFNSKLKHILTHSLFIENFILDFNVHHQHWPSPIFLDLPGEAVYNSNFLNYQKQLVQHYMYCGTVVQW